MKGPSIWTAQPSAWIPLLLVFVSAVIGSSCIEPAFAEQTSGATRQPAIESPEHGREAFEITSSGRELNLSSAETVILRTRLGVAGRQRIEIRNMSGATIRTLVDERRTPGDFEDAWDGYGDGGKRLPDGQYRWVSVLDTGRECLSQDLSAEVDGDYEVKSHPEYQPWAPFDNVPLRVEHAFERPGEILLVFSPVTFPVYARCDPPQFCRWLDGFHPSGPFVYEWAGADDTGAYRPDVHGILVISSQEQLSRNAIVIHGGRPGLSRIKALPAYYRPGGGPQKVAFTLAAHAGERPDLELTWTNHESLAVVRRIRREGVPPGLVEISWDGRSEGGIAAAPGGYTVRVVATDSVGNRTSGEILTTLEY
ncbi:MAG: hypothetical protein IT186_20470 [Acidobacteria bacterium]|nr:hypothetical protein [Acidobacteriota bacterium]